MQIDNQVSYNAASNGHIECLKFSIRHCPIHTYASTIAAINGHVDCLKFANENGSYIHINTLYAAIEFDRVECVKYIEECGICDIGSYMYVTPLRKL